MREPQNRPGGGRLQGESFRCWGYRFRKRSLPVGDGTLGKAPSGVEACEAGHYPGRDRNDWQLLVLGQRSREHHSVSQCERDRGGRLLWLQEAQETGF